MIAGQVSSKLGRSKLGSSKLLLNSELVSEIIQKKTKSLDPALAQFCHSNGLNQLNISNDQGFCALFVVNTPAVDDSGVSHGVEHLVFRRSRAFSQPETLFQLTSLTDLKINASTLSNVSYFHCRSQCQTSFLLGLHYLLNGLLHPVISSDDLTEEVYDDANGGVIFRELTGLQQDTDHLRQVQVDASDASPLRCNQYGGDSEMLAQLTVSDLVNYHDQHYQACDISLVTANVEPEQVAAIIEQLKPLAQPTSTAQPALKEQPVSRKQAHYRAKPLIIGERFDQHRQLLRWWFSAHYFDYFSQHQHQLADLLQSIDAELVTPQFNLNKNQQFALNIIVSNQSSTGAAQILNQFIGANPPLTSQFNHSYQSNNSYQNIKKYSPAINQLLTAYYQNIQLAAGCQSELDYAQQGLEQLKLPLPKPSRHNLKLVNHNNDKGQSSSVKQLKPVKQRKPLKPVCSKLIPQLTQLAPTLLLSRGDNNEVITRPLPDGVNQQVETVPKFLSALYQAATEKLTQGSADDMATAVNESDCMVVAKISSSQQALASITRFIIGAYPSFLAPRTQGHCYAMAALFISNSHHLVLFSALDVRPSSRLNDIGNSLLLLSDDLVFIRATLTLAKLKFSNYDDIDSPEISAITPQCIMVFLKQLSKQLLIASKRGTLSHINLFN